MLFCYKLSYFHWQWKMFWAICVGMIMWNWEKTVKRSQIVWKPTTRHLDFCFHYYDEHLLFQAVGECEITTTGLNYTCETSQHVPTESWCFLTAVERSLEHADFTGGPRNPVDSHLSHASPLHLLHTASHHMRDQHPLLSGRGLKVLRKKKTLLRCLIHQVDCISLQTSVLPHFCFSSVHSPTKQPASLPETSCPKRHRREIKL